MHWCVIWIHTCGYTDATESHSDPHKYSSTDDLDSQVKYLYVHRYPSRIWVKWVPTGTHRHLSYLIYLVFIHTISSSLPSSYLLDSHQNSLSIIMLNNTYPFLYFNHRPVNHIVHTYLFIFDMPGIHLYDLQLSCEPSLAWFPSKLVEHQHAQQNMAIFASW